MFLAIISGNLNSVDIIQSVKVVNEEDEGFGIIKEIITYENNISKWSNYEISRNCKSNSMV